MWSPVRFEARNIEIVLCYGTLSVKVRKGSFKKRLSSFGIATLSRIDTKACHAVASVLNGAVQTGTVNQGAYFFRLKTSHANPQDHIPIYAGD